jgi:hypothetical protein
MFGSSVTKSEHIYELLGFSNFDECNGHAWQGEGRCPYCSNAQLSSQRNQYIIKEALKILDVELNKGYEKVELK